MRDIERPLFSLQRIYSAQQIHEVVKSFARRFFSTLYFERGKKELTVVSVRQGGTKFAIEFLQAFVALDENEERIFVREEPIELKTHVFEGDTGIELIGGIRNPHYIAHRDVLVLDDILATGATFEYVGRLLKRMNPSSLHAMAVLQKLRVQKDNDGNQVYSPMNPPILHRLGELYNTIQTGFKRPDGTYV